MEAQALSLSSIVQHHPSIVSSELDDESILLNIETLVYHGLDDIATAVWEQMKRPIQVSNMIDHLLEIFDVDRQTCESETLDLLKLMLRRGTIALVSAETDQPT